MRKSPTSRPDSDCWDVQLKLFNPENERRAVRFYRFTVDVSETLPVTVGPVRTWSARSAAGGDAFSLGVTRAEPWFGRDMRPDRRAVGTFRP